jgi:plastocyanin
MSKLPMWAAMLLILAGPAVKAQDSQGTAPVVVEINNFAFETKELTVTRGAMVQWINNDSEPHTVVSSADPKAFRSPALDTGDKYAFVFKEAGTYKYFCSIHPHMTGTIIVK